MSLRPVVGALGPCRSPIRAVFIALCLVSLTATAFAAKSAFVLQSARGQVEVQASGKGGWKAVGGGARQASAGDHVRTGRNGSVYIITDDGARIALGPGTEVVLEEANQPHGWRVVLGRVLTYFSGSQRLEVRTPGAIAAAEGTVFQIDVGDDGATVLTVVEGKVQFYNELGSTLVLGSQQSTAEVGKAPTRPIAIDPGTLTAWEADTRTLLITPEYPLIGTNVEQVEQELTRRQQAAKEHPDEAAAHASLAEALLDLHRTEEATAEAQQAVTLNPDLGRAHGVLGFALLQAGRPAEANDQFALAAKAEPDQGRWPLGMGLVALGQRDVRPAQELLARAAQLAPNDPAPQAYLTAAYLRTGRLEQAQTAASEAVRLGPDSALANSYHSYLCLAQGNPDAAVSAGGKAVQEAPQSALAHEALGTALTFAGRPSEARQELDRAVALNPLSAGAHLARAKLLATSGDLEDALQEGQLAVSLDPQSAPARSTLGLLYLLNHDPQRAGNQFRQALTLEPSLSEAHTGWGRVLSMRGRFREAVEQQKLAVSLDTDSAAAQNNLGGVYASLGEMEKAREHLLRAAQLQPNWGLPYANLAVIYLEQNLYREALEAGERAVALGEHSAFTHTVLARIYAKQGRTDRALSELRYATALDDQYPQAHFQLARLYLDQGRSRDAIREILNSVTMDPSAMLETRQYARTENTVAAGSFGQLHYDARHSGQAFEGRVSYFVSGLLASDDGYRPVNQDTSEKFLEVIAGDQPQPSQQLVLFGTTLDRDSGLPGPADAGSLGDPDDRQTYKGYDAVLAYRQRLSRGVRGTLKYSFRKADLRFLNPDSLTGDDGNPFLSLQNESTQSLPEIRVDAALSERSSLRLGYARLRNETRNRGVASLFDPVSGDFFPGAFASDSAPVTDTSWLELATSHREDLDLTLGGYWGRETGSRRVLSPKLVALYRSGASAWWSLAVSPLFRSDVSELAPVEALADPKQLSFRDFAGGGSGRSYEVQYQRQGSRSSTTTASLTYQQVSDLLIDIKDPALTGLPGRVLLTDGHRWVADGAYERWLTGAVTGRAWVRWQSSSGSFPGLGATGSEWPRTPDWQAGGRVDYIDASGLRVGLEAVAVGSSFGDAENSRTVGSYSLLNLRVQFQQNLHRNYFVTVTNLTGTDYQTFAGFPQPGRAVIAGLEYRY